jgi:hypothetical protein
MNKLRKYTLLIKTAILKLIFLCTLIVLIQHGRAQENIVTVGIQFKPIIPIKYFFSEGTDLSLNNIQFQLEQKSGYSMGMVIRKGFTKILSFETGISFINRSYLLMINDSVEITNEKFRLIAYEIPINGLVYIRLSDKLFMNTALGLSLDLFPSDVYTENSSYQHYSQRRSWILPGVSANLGYEYRTEKAGYFYLGASYHRPFYDMYSTAIEYTNANNELTKVNTALAGNYLTIDFRYFFHEDPLKKKLKKKSSPKPD